MLKKLFSTNPQLDWGLDSDVLLQDKDIAELNPVPFGFMFGSIVLLES